MHRVPLERLLKTRRDGTFSRLHEGHPAHGRPRYFAPAYAPKDDEWARPRPDVPPIDLVAIPNAELRSDFMAYAGGKPITSEHLFPAYVGTWFATPGMLDSFHFPRVERVGAFSDPVFHVTHFNVRTYGHFLVEVLPKIVIARQLRAAGFPVKIAFPVNVPRGIVEAAVTVCGSPGHLIPIDPRKDRIKTPLALIPSLTQSPAADIHRVAIASLQQGAEELAPAPAGAPGPRIFLSRTKVSSFRKLVNEAELAAVAETYGFTVVHPQDMPWPQQVRMFRRATHVVGEYTSALHNTIFCRPEAKVVALGRMTGNPYQSAIAASVGHELGFVMPRDGRPVTFVPGQKAVQEFAIEPDDLKLCLDLIV